MVYIYGLYSDGINNIRYVGKTNKLKKRLNEHIKDSINKKTHKHFWINSELKKGKNIKIIVLEECDNDSWKDREKYWISYYNNLTNITPGGEGGFVNS